ncbi:MAG: putative toxin [Ruminococcus flavefaciens]|nr:putative toxin [Ruminococcus flavefaciens]
MFPSLVMFCNDNIKSPLLLVIACTVLALLVKRTGAYYTNNRIILLSDGEDGSYSSTLSLLHSIYDENSTDKRKSIKIYTIGLGSSYDSRLEEIANISHGEFFKAYTAYELVDIYTEIGLDGDFDTTDTDGDGLYDAVEAAGIRIQNGTILYCDHANPDTDGDGLKDGEEIDPTIRRKHNYWGSTELVSRCSGQYYFVMISNPTEIDSDGDGIDDFNDCYPSDPEASLDDEELYGLYQYFLDLNNENISKRAYIYTPENWENELYDNINETISKIPDDLTQSERTLIIDSVIIIEANDLQEKYKTVYYASDNFISKYITERGFHQSLVPLFTQYPVYNKNDHPYLRAFFEGFTAGFQCGLMYAASDTIASYEYNDSMAYARKVGKAGEIASGITKNTRHIESITKTATYRIPDGLDDVSMILSEVKNVKYQGLTSQIKDFLYYSQREGYQFELYVRSTTKISKPLQELIDSGEIILKYLS